MSSRFDEGLAVRRKVLGDDYVNRSMANADEFLQPLQEMITEYCWERFGLALVCRLRLVVCSTWR